MRSLSIRAQKILTWIPVANFFVFLIWGITVRWRSNSEKKQGMMICIGTTILLVLIHVLISSLMSEVEPFSEKVIIFLYPIILDWQLVKLQERFSERKDNTE